MRVAVIINSRAGFIQGDLIRKKVEEALFRCELRFSNPGRIAEMDQFIQEEIEQADYFMICGGDGTINVALQSLMRQSAGRELPPLCLVRSGTANDLATEIGVSHRIESAARCLLSGKIKKIDLIELQSDSGEKAFMITNGGVGIPALIADAANRVRGHIGSLAAEEISSGLMRFVANSAQRLIKKSGSGVYMMMIAEAMRQWTDKDWEVEVEIPGRLMFTTKASSILISNQPRMGKNMIPAPYTSNNDGLMNVLVTEAATLKDQIRAVLSLREGKPDTLTMNRSFEVAQLRLKSLGLSRSLTFFGDGEILLKGAREITLRCHHQSLSVAVRDSR